MSQHWPPTPSVEDEDDALAREHDIDKALSEPKSENQPASSRGTVDQYPIILDVDLKTAQKPKQPANTADLHSQKSDSSDESYGPTTPPSSKAEQRFTYIPKPATQASQDPPPHTDSGRTKRDASRGRPSVARIQTDLAGDLKGMVTGERRAPSPYAFKPTPRSEKAEHGNRFSRECLLSPEHAKTPIVDSNRDSSARPRIRTEDADSSTDSDRRPERRRHHSRRRSPRQSFSEVDRPDVGPALHPDVQQTKNASFAPNGHQTSMLSKGLQRQSRAPPIVEQASRPEKRTPRDSPYTASVDESRQRSGAEHHVRSDDRSSKDSPHTSSAEESRRRHHHQDRHEVPSRRGSMLGSARPKLESLTPHYSYGGGDTPEERYESRLHRHDRDHHSVLDGRYYLEPNSPRSPKAVEELLEKAFKENSAKKSGTSIRESPAASPLASPPGTPPRTPRGQRRPKEHFPITASMPIQAPIQRSRPPSREENYIKPLVAAMASASVGGLATRMPPLYSRSSTSSAELHSGGYASNQSNGRRSRASSPKREDPRPLSRSGSTSQFQPKPVLKAPTLPAPPADARPLSRSGSIAPQPTEPPQLVQRAFSYSSRINSANPRPSSSAGLPSAPQYVPVVVTQAGPNQPAPMHLRSPRPSSEKLPTLPPAGVPARGLPPCPRPEPVAGYQDWYAIKQMPEMAICPDCMSYLGNTHFRDCFVPSLPRPLSQKIPCAMGQPWIRHAWIQILKQHRKTLEVLYQLIHRPTGTNPCPGKKIALRSWYRLIDPETGTHVPNFEACSACVRAVGIIFPQLRGIFIRSPNLLQERFCDLTGESKRFDGYMAQMDAAAIHYDIERLRQPDIQALADHARRVARVRECARDDRIRQQMWHFMPQLPHFTICEECFQDVVWPVIDRPIARMVNRTLELAPGTRQGQHDDGVSCQLYSDRMRSTFLDAVQFQDFELLKSVSTRRVSVERLLQERQKILIKDMEAGIDRTTEIQENIMQWKKFE